MILLQLRMQLCGHLDMVNVIELMAQAAQQLGENLIVDLPLPADAKNALPLPVDAADVMSPCPEVLRTQC